MNKALEDLKTLAKATGATYNKTMEGMMLQAIFELVRRVETLEAKKEDNK